MADTSIRRTRHFKLITDLLARSDPLELWRQIGNRFRYLRLVSGADPCFLEPELHHGDRPIDFEHVAYPIQQSIGCERFLHEIVRTGGTEFGDAIVLDHPRDA